MSVWVLTSEVNEYDQYGEYFVCAFTSKPSFHEVKLAVIAGGYGVDDSTIDLVCGNLIRSGGGRINSERWWFYLRNVETKN